MIKKVGITTGVIVLAVYIGMAVFFMGHFEFNTTINEMKASMCNVGKMQDKVAEEAKKYVLTINGREGAEDPINADEIDMEPQFDDTFSKLLKSQNAFAWPVSLFKKTELSANTVVEYSDEKLNAKIDKLAFLQNERAPQDAHLSDYTDEGYTVIPADNGTTVDKEKLAAVVTNAVSTLEDDLDLDASGVYENAAVATDDKNLNELAENLNRCVNSKITFTFGSSVETLEGSTIKEWIAVSDDNSVSVDSAKAREYVNSLSRKYDTFGQPRHFRTTAGDEITVTGGSYGWWTDRPATAAELTEAIMNGQSGNLDVVYRAAAAQYGDSDIGNSYVEINIGAQHLYVYKDGQIVCESDFVSGGLFKGNNTPDGTYPITYKEQDATLVGENYSSDVSYWMPFNGNIGMHDASWRSSFGGHIYYLSGSHGCVNLPVSKAKEIFGYVEKGEAVVVYGGITTDQAWQTMSAAEQMQCMAKGYTPPLTAEQQLAIAAAQQAGQVSGNAAQ